MLCFSGIGLVVSKFFMVWFCNIFTAKDIFSACESGSKNEVQRAIRELTRSAAICLNVHLGVLQNNDEVSGRLGDPDKYPEVKHQFIWKQNQTPQQIGQIGQGLQVAPRKFWLHCQREREREREYFNFLDFFSKVFSRFFQASCFWTNQIVNESDCENSEFFNLSCPRKASGTVQTWMGTRP